MLRDLQRLLVAAMREPDPSGFLHDRAANDPALGDDERRWLRDAADDGLRLSRVLVRKLRLQRIVRGDPDAARQMAADPQAFAQRFAAYDRDVPMTAVTPREEAEAFRRY